MAFQSTPNPLPPTIIHPSKSKTHRISPSAAHEFLTAYLNRATTDPSLQPNSILTAHGPTSASTGSAPNLIIHNLKRVQAGLAGEVLGRDLTFAKPEDGGPVLLMSEMMEGDGEDWSGKGKVEVVDAGEGDGDGDGDGGGDVEEGDQVPVGMRMDVDAGDGVVGGGEVGIDKEERKRRKKERRKAEKKVKSKTAAVT
ncbi:hypothetical protein ACO22_03231 [Paracoccidioides brasiliensis]|uniref:Uncharacterized protein n=1 Tax=Paracoccidioides brasiliensis TaxID=121759 RepID=A0A1D2JGM0_PARBR|nr:hypothetical protein ACO22_03231 [Paracoccidioides brasiliensis]